MTDGKCSEMSEKELIKCALDHMSEDLCFVDETESDVGNALYEEGLCKDNKEIDE